MNWVDVELVLISITAMVSPTTLTFSILALVLGERPLRTGWWFYLGALGATLAVGVAAAFVLGDTAAARDPSSPKTWVAIFDLVAASLLFAYVAKTRNRPLAPDKVDGMVARMSKVASSPAIAIVGAGAVLANPGAFIPLALKSISETDPTAAGYLVEWLFFAFVSLLPLAIALVMLLVARDWAGRVLTRVRDWLIANARTVASVIVLLLAVALLRNGISGLV
jgi:Sap-like sulfolipid-1-addressing protein